MVFGVLLTLDGGASIVGQAGRVHEQYEGQGFFRYVSCIMYLLRIHTYICDKVQKYQCVYKELHVFTRSIYVL